MAILTSEELERWNIVQQKRKLLDGTWDDLAKENFRKMFSHKYSIYGKPSIVSNVFKKSCEDSCGLYDEHPIISNDKDPISEIVMRNVLQKARYNPTMQSLQLNCIGIREMLLFINVFEKHNEVHVSLLPVFPDEVVITPDSNKPDQPIEIIVQKTSDIRKPNEKFWHVYSLKYGPKYQILDSDENDVSEMFGLPQFGLRDEAYPYIDLSGNPFLPFVLYHAQVTGNLWNYNKGRELVQGTLDLSSMITFFTHSLKTNSFPQRYMINAVIDGVVADDSNNASVAIGDPSVVLPLSSPRDGSGQPVAGQWTSGDSESIINAITKYEQTILSSSSLDKVSVVRNQSEIKSGYSLAVEREMKNETRKIFGPIFKQADKELMEKIAKMYNVVSGQEVLAEDGWRVEYAQNYQPIEIEQAERERVLSLLNSGLMSKVEARMKLFGETEEEAIRSLAKVELV